MNRIESVEQLEAIYGEPAEASVVKVTDYITPHYAAFIEASPFVALATSGPEGLDCSPRGDLAGFVRMHDVRNCERELRGRDRVESSATQSDALRLCGVEIHHPSHGFQPAGSRRALAADAPARLLGLFRDSPP